MPKKKLTKKEQAYAKRAKAAAKLPINTVVRGKDGKVKSKTLAKKGKQPENYSGAAPKKKVATKTMREKIKSAAKATGKAIPTGYYAEKGRMHTVADVMKKSAKKKKE